MHCQARENINGLNVCIAKQGGYLMGLMCVLPGIGKFNGFNVCIARRGKNNGLNVCIARQRENLMG